MKIKFNTYLKKNGKLMLFINNDRKVSIDLSGESISYSKMTDGQKKLWDAACNYMKEKAIRFTGDLSNHLETGYCSPIKVSETFTLVGTDISQIGGMKVGSDGSYVIANGGIAYCGEWIDTDMEESC